MERQTITNGFHKGVQDILGKAMDISYKLPNSMPYDVRGIEKIPTDMPCLFVINHSNSHDYPNLMKFLYELSRVRERRCVNTLVASDSLDKKNEMIFNVSGAELIDRFDKDSASQGLANLRQRLREGNDVAIFGESTWNLHPYVPMLVVKKGFAQLASGERVAIVPLIFEYVETKDICYVESELYDKFIVSVCSPYVINENDDLLARANEIRKIMGDARIELWKENKTHKPTLEGRKLKALEEIIYLKHTELKKNGMGFSYDSVYELDNLLPLGDGFGVENEYIRNEAGLFVPLTKENVPKGFAIKPIRNRK